MRESRTSGSARGARSNPRPYRVHSCELAPHWSAGCRTGDLPRCGLVTLPYLSGSPALRRPSKKCSASSVRLKAFNCASVPSIVYPGSIRSASAASALAFSISPSCA